MINKTLSCSNQGLVYSQATNTCSYALPLPECPPSIPQIDPVAVKVCSGMHSFRYYAGVRCSASCPLGYVAASTTYSCETSGNWSGGALACQPLACPTLATPTNGYIMGNLATGVTGTVRYFACNSGYTLSGSNSTTCEPTSAWSFSPPSCLRKLGRSYSQINYCRMC